MCRSAGHSPVEKARAVISGHAAYRFWRPIRATRTAVAVVKTGDPWKSYTKKHDIKLDTLVDVCRKSPDVDELFGIRKLPFRLSDSQIQHLQQIRHPNFLQVFEIFDDNGDFYTVSEHAHVTLEEAIWNGKDFSDRLLGSIIYHVSFDRA